jgi:hypothetical protein
MKGKADGNRGARRAIALAVAAAAVAILVQGCGGGSSSSSASGPAYSQQLALATCMRSHGEPHFPDPDASGGYSVTASGTIAGSGGAPVDINSGQAQAAYGDCRHLLSGAPSISQLEQRLQQGQQQQARNLPQLLKWEQCVRSHGEPTFSLPLGGQSPAPANGGVVNPSSPQFQAALSSCHHLLPPGVNISAHTSASAS